MQRYTQELLGFLHLFEEQTKVQALGCFPNAALLFVVRPGEGGLAIGRGGERVRRVAWLLKRPVNVVELSDDPVKFAENLIFPAKGKVYMGENRTVILEGKGARFKSLVLGPQRQHLRHLQGVFAEYFKDWTLEVR